MQYALNYSGTRFLYTENQNYSMSWWIPSYQTLHNFYKSLSPEGVRLINHSFLLTRRYALFQVARARVCNQARELILTNFFNGIQSCTLKHG